METIIKKAIEGGYNLISPEGWELSLEELDLEQNESVVLDPLFWQALANALQIQDLKTTLHARVSPPWWLVNALRFHEINLTEDWDSAVKYLEDLVK